MSFPTELNPLAVRQVFAFISGNDRDPGRTALAAYEVIGYALGRFWGSAKYLSAELPQGEPLLMQMESELATAQAQGKLGDFFEKYGPVILSLLLKLLVKSPVPTP